MTSQTETASAKELYDELAVLDEKRRRVQTRIEQLDIWVVIVGTLENGITRVLGPFSNKTAADRFIDEVDGPLQLVDEAGGDYDCEARAIEQPPDSDRNWKHAKEMAVVIEGSVFAGIKHIYGFQDGDAAAMWAWGGEEDGEFVAGVFGFEECAVRGVVAPPKAGTGRPRIRLPGYRPSQKIR